MLAGRHYPATRLSRLVLQSRFYLSVISNRKLGRRTRFCSEELSWHTTSNQSISKHTSLSGYRAQKSLRKLGGQNRTMVNALAEDSQYTVPHAKAAWEFFRSIGSPKYHVAPMVDQSELPFRMLCRNHGATAAYTPMLHARLFLEGPAYREEHFTTCAEDRPLFVQFCANDPDTVLKAAQLVEDRCDAVDLNLGCPQRIARRGKYGAFLMDDLDLVERIVRKLSGGLKVPVTVKIRRFSDVEKTIAYAKMLENAGAYIVAVHGRTREQKTAKEVRADWDVIKAVKDALEVPVLANGNIQTLHDVHRCMEYTGADGVMSAESLLEDPALFAARRLQPSDSAHLEGCKLLLEYLDLLEQYPCPTRMVRGHVFKLLGNWLQEHTDLRDRLAVEFSVEGVREMTQEMQRRIEACGRTVPEPKMSERARLRLEQESVKRQRIEEQERIEAVEKGLEMAEKLEQNQIHDKKGLLEPQSRLLQQQHEKFCSSPNMSTRRGYPKSCF